MTQLSRLDLDWMECVECMSCFYVDRGQQSTLAPVECHKISTWTGTTLLLDPGTIR